MNAGKARNQSEGAQHGGEGAERMATEMRRRKNTYDKTVIHPRHWYNPFDNCTPRATVYKCPPCSETFQTNMAHRTELLRTRREHNAEVIKCEIKPTINREQFAMKNWNFSVIMVSLSHNVISQGGRRGRTVALQMELLQWRRKQISSSVYSAPFRLFTHQPRSNFTRRLLQWKKEDSHFRIGLSSQPPII